jgi:hypothetical protein
VDKNDVVKYFSAGKERIFTRTRAVIGRTVQNCHPPANVHVVENIYDAVKTVSPQEFLKIIKGK